MLYQYLWSARNTRNHAGGQSTEIWLDFMTTPDIKACQGSTLPKHFLVMFMARIAPLTSPGNDSHGCDNECR